MCIRKSTSQLVELLTPSVNAAQNSIINASKCLALAQAISIFFLF